MLELFNATFSAVNIIPAIFLTFVVFYWLLVILGALDVSSFDFDFEIDVDLDVDADVDIDADGGTSDVSVVWLNNLLSFFNIDKLPLMIFFTLWAVPLWVISVLTNRFLGNESFLFSLVLLAPILVVSLLIAKPLTVPFVRLFSKLEDGGVKQMNLLGKVGRVVVSASDTKMGQADVGLDGASYRLNIKTREGSIKRGQSLLVVNYVEDGQYYVVEPYETVN